MFESQGFRQVADSCLFQKIDIHNTVPRIGFQGDSMNMRLVGHIQSRECRTGYQPCGQLVESRQIFQWIQGVDGGIIRMEKEFSGCRGLSRADEPEIRILASHISFRIQHDDLYLDIRILHAEQRGKCLDDEKGLRRTDQNAVSDRDARRPEERAEHFSRLLIIHR